MQASSSVRKKRESETQIDALNELLQCEISATETYQRVVKTLRFFFGRSELESFADDHKNAYEKLRERIIFLGGEALKDAGVWGKWTKGIEESRISVGDIAGIDALRQEEEDSIKGYEKLLNTYGLDIETNRLIKNTLLPLAQTRLNRLNKFATEITLLSLP